MKLADIRQRLAVFYRALGGSGAVRVAAATAAESGHRLSLRQRLGFGERETLDRATFDGEVLALPPAIGYFRDPGLNAALYRWLAAFFACSPQSGSAAGYDHPLHRDVHGLRLALATSRRVCDEWPGLRKTHRELCAAIREIRPRRNLEGWEAAVEQAIDRLLGGEVPGDDRAAVLMEVIDGAASRIESLPEPRKYRPYLPVPLWGELVERPASPDRGSDAPPGHSAADADERRRRSRRRPTDRAERPDSLILNRFEYLLSLAEMMNLNRSVDDDDPDAARQAADNVDEITVGEHPRESSSRLKLDLELAPPAADTTPLAAEFSYPEWDFKRQRWHENHCRVVAGVADRRDDDWHPDFEARRRIRRVRRQFEALRPRRRLLQGQDDGDELDLSALIRSRADQRSGRPGSDQVFMQSRNVERDLSVALLIDASLSTDSYVENRRVLDIEKEAVLSLVHGLEACGDEHAVFAFTSRTRREVSVATIKEFDEPLGETVRRRLQGLKPGYYTRIGAALRHTAYRLRERGTRHRLLLLVTDGKPNDMDHYEGRYGIEDTRRAVQAARREGLAVFGITVDRKARDYFPYLFGRGGFAIVRRAARLPEILPVIYHHITQ